MSIHDPNVKIFHSSAEASEAAVKLGFTKYIIICDSTGYSVRLFRNGTLWGVIGLGEMPEQRWMTSALVKA